MHIFLDYKRLVSCYTSFQNCNTRLTLQESSNPGAATEMRLSLVFELLLIFILLAFAASRVIGKVLLLEYSYRQGEGEGKVQLSLCLTKCHAMKTYPVLNQAPRH